MPDAHRHPTAAILCGGSPPSALRSSQTASREETRHRVLTDAGTTWWNVSGMLLAAQEDGRDLATAQVVCEMSAAWEQHRMMRRAREERAERRRWVRERGLVPGAMVIGPEGQDDWWVGLDGDLNPPCEPPSY